MDIELKPLKYPIVGYTDWKNKIIELVEEIKQKNQLLDGLPGRPSLVSDHGDQTVDAMTKTHKIIFELVIYAWSIRFCGFLAVNWKPRTDLNKPEVERDEETKKDRSRIMHMRNDAIDILSKIRLLRLFYVKNWLYIDDHNRGKKLTGEHVKNISDAREELARAIENDSVGGQALRGVPAALCISRLLQAINNSQY